MKMRKCNICRRELSMSDFGMRLDKSGKRLSCESCYRRQQVAKKKAYRSTYKEKFPKREAHVDLKEPIELDFLLDLNGWTTDEIKSLLITVRTYTSMPYRMKPRDIFKKYIPGRSAPECHKILLEFKEVAAAGLQFDAYMKTDRKYRKDGKRILAKSPK